MKTYYEFVSRVFAVSGFIVAIASPLSGIALMLFALLSQMWSKEED